MEGRKADPPLWLSLLPVAFLIGMLILNVSLFGEDASSGANQLALLFGAGLAGGIGHFVLRLPYREIESRAIKSIVLAMEAIIILIVVGALIGLWIISGIVPTMLYYGIKMLSPGVFLLVACLICSVVSLAIGSSWSTMGTVGVALIGVGKALGFPEPLVAGAVISGAYFGDKMSPLSDTTNLAPAIAGTDLFTHVRNMFYTTIPSYALTLVSFAGIGLFCHPGAYSSELVAQMLATIEDHFTIHWGLLLVPGLVIVIAARRVPAIPSLVAGLVLGALAALLFQGGALSESGATEGRLGAYRVLVQTAYSGYEMRSGVEAVDALLSRGGMMGMFNTILLILTAMLFGGAMEATGMLPAIARAILRRVRSAGGLVRATVASCVLFNITAAEQYLAIVVPGRMFREAYDQYNLEPRNLSRALEDGGTVTSVLVPWNTCGAFASAALGVSTLSYAPFALFNIYGPIVSMVLATLGLGIVYKKAADA